MLRHTFLHLPGVGPKTEEMFWRKGIWDWERLGKALGSGKPIPFKKNRALLEEELLLSEEMLQKEDPGFFAARLTPGQCWRLLPAFLNSAAYLDIETTGLGSPGDHITTISLYDGERLRYYIWGKNLEEFLEDVMNYHLLVTYNGRCFDIPFIERQFGIVLPQAQLDLRCVLGKLGYRGGLKGCEKQMGIRRGELEDVDGYAAVLLWREYSRRGSVDALETLLAYNMEDTVNLEELARRAYNQMVRLTPFGDNLLPLPPKRPPIPFQPSRRCLEKVRLHCGRRFWG